jgi:fructose-1-phosphate kinase PfkB-like protein
MRSLYPTGAGDVYSAAFLIKYFETGEPMLSGYFASAAASLLVEKGVGGITDRGVVEERMGKLVRQNEGLRREEAGRHRGL